MRRTALGLRCRPPRGLIATLAATAAALILVCSAAAPARAQAVKKATPPPPDTRPLARYIARDNLLIYAGTDGLDNQGEVWKKTAAYKMLNDTTLGAMLEDVAAQTADQALALSPNRKLNGADFLKIIKQMGKSGFAFAVNPAPKGQTADAPVLITFVVRGAAQKEALPSFARLMGTFMGAAKAQTVKKGSRTVIIVPSTAKDSKQTWAWWAEKQDLVVAVGKNSEDVVMAVIDGKRPSAVEHPVRAELARTEGGFTPVFQAFVDPSAMPKEAAPGPLSTILGQLSAYVQTNLGTRVDYRWGLQDDALMSVSRLKAVRPRRGMLAILDQPQFEKAKLPPLPEGIESFTVVSAESGKLYDFLMALPNPAIKGPLTDFNEALKAKGRVDLRKDVLAHLGTKFAFYVMPVASAGHGAAATATATAPSPAPAAATGNPLLGMLGAGQVPRFTLVAEVDDNLGFGRILDNIMIAANAELKDRANEAADKLPPPKPEPGAPAAKTRREPPATARFVLTPSNNPAERSYVLNLPPSMVKLYPPGFRPTVRLGNKQLILSTTPESARLALEVKAGQYVPPADLLPAFDPLPKELIILGARDPRATLPENLASLPAGLQRGINTLIAQNVAIDTTPDPAAPPGAAPAPAPPGVAPAPAPAPAQGAPAAPGAPAAVPMLIFNIPVSKLPKADDLRAKLFPGSFAVSSDDQEIRYVTRAAFPNVISPTAFATFAAAFPAIQAASRNKAADAAPAATATEAPGTSKTHKGADTKKGPVRVIPKD